MRLRTLIALLLAFALLAAACSGDDSDSDGAGGATGVECPTKTDGQLTVATGEPVFEPWMVDDDPSNGQGFESAIVYSLAAEMGIDTVVWTRTGFDDAISPGSKDYDFNIQQYSITDVRDEVVDFSDSYYSAEQAIIGSPDNAIASATSLADLKGARLGAAIATTQLDYIETVIQPDSAASVYNDNADAKSAFDAGQVDGIIFDLPTAYYITAVEIEDAEIIGVLPRVGDSPEDLGMLFEEGSALVPCVNAALSVLRDDGTLEAIEEAWLSQGGNIPTLSQ